MSQVTPRIRYVGLDVHKEAITVVVAEEAGRPQAWGTIANDPQAVRQLSREGHQLRLAYEAGPTGYVLQRQLTPLGVECQVVAPSLIPKSTSGRRVKTDSRDAEQLARLLSSGDLVAIWVPEEEHEAFREVVRARFVAKKDVERHRHQLVKQLAPLGSAAAGSGQAVVEALPALAGRAEPPPSGPADGAGRLSKRAVGGSSS